MGQIAIPGERFAPSAVKWALLCIVSVVTWTIAGQAIGHPHPLDWLDFIFSARRLDLGLDPYVHSASVAQPWSDLAGVNGFNANPPVLFPLFQAVAWLDARTSLFWAQAVNLALLASSLGLAGVFRGRLTPLQIWCAISAPAVCAIYEGQIYGVLALLLTLAYLNLVAGRPRAAGIYLGILCALKPNFGLCILALFAGGFGAAAVCAAAVAAACHLAALGLYGLPVYEAWLRSIAGMHWLLGSVSIRLLLDPTPLRWLWPYAAIAGAIVTISVIARCRPDARLVLLYSAAAAMLFSPVAWIGYVIMLYPLLLRGPVNRLIVAGLVCMVPFAQATPASAIANVAYLLYPAGMLALWLGIAISLRRLP